MMKSKFIVPICIGVFEHKTTYKCFQVLQNNHATAKPIAKSILSSYYQQPSNIDKDVYLSKNKQYADFLK